MRRDSILERLVSLNSGGRISDENTPGQDYFLRVLQSMREVAIREEYRRDRVVSEQNYQSFYPVYDKDINAGCEDLYKYECPRPLRIDSVMSGFGYVGQEHGRGAFQFYPSPDAYFNAQRHRVTRAKDVVSAYYDSSEGVLWVDKPVKKFLVRICAQRPEDVYTFNVTLDDYPMSMKSIEIMEEFLRNGTIGYILRTPPNKVSNTQDDKHINIANE